MNFIENLFLFPVVKKFENRLRRFDEVRLQPRVQWHLFVLYVLYIFLPFTVNKVYQKSEEQTKRTLLAYLHCSRVGSEVERTRYNHGEDSSSDSQQQQQQQSAVCAVSERTVPRSTYMRYVRIIRTQCVRTQQYVVRTTYGSSRPSNHTTMPNDVASTMQDVFEPVSMRNVINFIKETNFCNLL